MFNDNDIKKSAEHLDEVLLHILDNSNEPPHVFSTQFEEKMELIIKKHEID